jgi:O-antigen/teichoic acid export membrane protein
MTVATELHEPATSDIGRRYAQAAIYSGALGGVSQALYGLTPVVIARSLGPADYGIYSIVMSLSAIVIGVFGLGQNSALHKLVPQYYASDRARGGAILADVLILTSGLLAVFCAVFFFLSGWIATRLYRDASLTGVFRFCALLMLALTLFNVASSAIAGMQDFRSYNRIQVARNLALLALAGIGVWLAGLYGALAGQLLASLFGLALLGASGARLVRERFPGGVRPVYSRDVLGVIASFILPTLLITLLNLPAYWWASTMVARRAGFEQVGLLGVAYTLSQLTLLIPMNLYTPAMTFLSEARAASQSTVFTSMVSANLRAMWTFSMPLALGYALLAPLLIKTLFGAAYLAAAPLTFALSFTALLMLLVGLLNTAITASGHVWSGFWITFGWTLIFVVAGLICIPRWGAAGCATVFAVTHVFYLTGALAYSRLALRVKYEKLGRLIILTALSFGAAAIIIFNCQGATAYAAGGALLLCLIVAEWLWIFDGGERDRLRGFLSRRSFRNGSEIRLPNGSCSPQRRGER